MATEVLGIIGGSGLYQLAGLTQARRRVVRTPFGKPSDAYLVGKIGSVPVAFLARHGEGHRLMPSEINVRANIYGFKALGVTRLVSVTAVGSMQESIAPGDACIPAQLIDRTTRHDQRTFFGGGIVGHVAMADPYCAEWSQALGASARDAWSSGRVHEGGTYICIDGPQFSTRAESQLYRSWGVSVIGMTNAPEAMLAREGGLCFATLALATDYDCWHDTHAAVTVDQVIATLNANADSARRTLTQLAARIPGERRCACARALDSAIMTRPDRVPAAVRKKLALILPRGSSARSMRRRRDVSRPRVLGSKRASKKK